MLALVKAFDFAAIANAIAASPELLSFRDERGRNWLHLCCATKPRSPRQVHDSVRTAQVLLESGLDINREAFTEDDWKATPLWFAIARGENLALAEFLLKCGSNPNYCLWAASFRNDLDAIRLLVRYGADVNDACLDESPLLGAVKWSKFSAAADLLRLGANPDYRDSKGMTALHYMLKKDSDKRHFAMFVAHGARADIKNGDGVTAADLMRRKRDRDFHRIADRLR